MSARQAHAWAVTDPPYDWEREEAIAALEAVERERFGFLDAGFRTTPEVEAEVRSWFDETVDATPTKR